MRELTLEETNEVSGGISLLAAGPWALAAVGAFGVGYAIGTLIYEAIS